MLKSIDPILTPDLLWLLASMGHGDDLVFVDANHPATRIAQSTTSQRLIQLPGMSMEVAIRAIMSVYPLDDFDPDPVRVMMPVDDPAACPRCSMRCWRRSRAPPAAPSLPASSHERISIVRRRQALASCRSATAGAMAASCSARA